MDSWTPFRKFCPISDRFRTISGVKQLQRLACSPCDPTPVACRRFRQAPGFQHDYVCCSYILPELLARMRHLFSEGVYRCVLTCATYSFRNRTVFFGQLVKGSTCTGSTHRLYNSYSRVLLVPGAGAFDGQRTHQVVMVGGRCSRQLPPPRAPPSSSLDSTGPIPRRLCT